jgi:hypothetical protein
VQGVVLWAGHVRESKTVGFAVLPVLCGPAVAGGGSGGESKELEHAGERHDIVDIRDPVAESDSDVEYAWRARGESADTVGEERDSEIRIGDAGSGGSAVERDNSVLEQLGERSGRVGASVGRGGAGVVLHADAISEVLRGRNGCGRGRDEQTVPEATEAPKDIRGVWRHSAPEFARVHQLDVCESGRSEGSMRESVGSTAIHARI